MREPRSSRDIFSRQAAKVSKTCIPCAAFAFFAPLREDKQHARASLLAGYFFSPSRKGRKDLYTLRCLGEQCTQCREGLHALPQKMTQPL